MLGQVKRCVVGELVMCRRRWSRQDRAKLEKFAKIKELSKAGVKTGVKQQAPMVQGAPTTNMVCMDYPSCHTMGGAKDLH